MGDLLISQWIVFELKPIDDSALLKNKKLKVTNLKIIWTIIKLRLRIPFSTAASYTIAWSSRI